MATDPDLLHSLAWSSSELGEALQILASKAKLLSNANTILPSIPDLNDSGNEEIGNWVDVIALHLGFEAEAVEAQYDEMDRFTRSAFPAIYQLPKESEGDPLRFLVVLKGNWRRLTLIKPDHSNHGVNPRIVCDALCRQMESPIAERIGALATGSDDTGIGHAKGQSALARELIIRNGWGQHPVGNAWIIRPSPSAPLRNQAAYQRLIPRLSMIVVLIVAWQLLQLLSWVLIGQGVFKGYFDRAWFSAWILVMFTGGIFQWLSYNRQSKFFVSVGQVFKPIFLYGATRLDPDAIRNQGAGQFLARVMQAVQLETTVLIRGMNAVIYLVMLLVSGIFLALGAGGMLHVALLLVWILVFVYLSWRCLCINREWLAAYRNMTNDLVERMVGHRTRLIQENPEDRHTEEDQFLQEYLQLTERLNRVEILIDVVIPRGWLMVGLTGIALPLLTGSASPQKIALSVGGILLTYQAFESLTRKFSDFLAAFLSWDQVQPLLNAATRPIDDQYFSWSIDEDQPLLRAANLVFRYHSRTAPVIEGCSIQIHQGDRLLLEGPSGGGKTTLVTLLSGLYTPESGMLSLWGFDRRTMGTRTWRKRIVSVPQFQENHIISESLAYNVFMGHRWPPEPQDLEEADEICRELGLGELIEQMPEGLYQQVGDSGWRLSHGERSRIFIARALLQKPDLLILDESFGALDPETLRSAMQCVLNRASTVLVIAHP